MYTLITDVSKGMGAAFARRMAGTGQPLILVVCDRARLRRLKTGLEQEHAIPVQMLALDLTQPGAAAALYVECTGRGRPVSQFINMPALTG